MAQGGSPGDSWTNRLKRKRACIIGVHTGWTIADGYGRPYFTGSLTKATLLKPALEASASISAT